MQITVFKSGGIGAPATDETWGPLDTGQAGEVGQQLEGLVASIGFFDLPSDYPPKGPDRFNYTVDVEDGDRQARVTYSEDSDQVPAGLAQITALVREESTG
jgi:Emfourin